MPTSAEQLMANVSRYCLTDAYLGGTNGMVEHTVAVRNFAAKKQLVAWERNVLSPQAGSNYLHHGFAFERLYLKDQKPTAENPNSSKHKELFTAAEVAYGDLQWQTLRTALVGEEALDHKNYKEPISDGELPYYLARGRERGLLEFGDFKGVQDRIERERVGSLTPMSLRMAFLKAGIFTDYGRFESTVEEASFLERLREPMLRAAVLRLGAMVAVTDNVVFLMNAVGQPIPFNFTPPVWSERAQEIWDEKIGIPVLGLEDLYLKAHGLLVELSEPSNQLLGYLHGLKELPFAR